MYFSFKLAINPTVTCTSSLHHYN